LLLNFAIFLLKILLKGYMFIIREKFLQSILLQKIAYLYLSLELLN